MNLKSYLKNDGLAVVITSALLVFAGYFFYPENPTFLGVSPHPYFIIAILFSAYAGLRSAIVMALVLSAQLIIILHQAIDYQEVETIVDYKYLSTPISIIIFSIILGEFRTRQSKKDEASRSKQLEQDEVIKSLMNRTHNLIEESKEIKKQLISRLDTFATTSSRMHRFQLRNEDDIYQELINFLSSELGVTDARVFKYKEGAGTYVAMEKTEMDTDIQNDPLFISAIEFKKPAYIKEYLRSSPKANTILMACFPIIENDKVIAVVPVLEIDFLNHTAGNLLTIKQIITWAETCLLYAKEIRTLTQNSIINPELQIHTRQYFLDRLIEEHEFALRYNKTIHIIKMEIKGLALLTPLKRTFARKIVAQNLISTLRKMDCICEGAQPDVFYIILHLPNPEHSHVALERVRASMDNLVTQTNSQETLATEIKLIEHSKLGTLEQFIELITNA